MYNKLYDPGDLYDARIRNCDIRIAPARAPKGPRNNILSPKFKSIRKL